MPPDHSVNALILGFMASLPAVLLALAALWKSVRGETRVNTLEKAANGQKDRLVRDLIEDAWKEGHRAGMAEQQALYTQPPKNPGKLG